MNVLELYITESPYGKEDECAKLSIFDTAEWFILSDTTTVGLVYTFSAWIKSDADGSFTVGESYIKTTTKWVKYKATFTANDVDLKLIFSTPGTYYLYNTQLEIGKIASDWSPAPEDIDTSDELSETNDQIQILRTAISEFVVEKDSIWATVKNVEKTYDSVNGEITSLQNEVADMRLYSENLKLDFKNIVDNGPSKVTTETGFTFDRDGMTVDASDSTTKTQVTPDGMTVYKKDADGGQEEVLEATSEGVDATNLHAKTYLIIGGRSRFENYGTNRTGCFWIGG